MSLDIESSVAEAQQRFNTAEATRLARERAEQAERAGRVADRVMAFLRDQTADMDLPELYDTVDTVYRKLGDRLEELGQHAINAAEEEEGEA